MNFPSIGSPAYAILKVSALLYLVSQLACIMRPTLVMRAESIILYGKQAP